MMAEMMPEMSRGGSGGGAASFAAAAAAIAAAAAAAAAAEPNATEEQTAAVATAAARAGGTNADAAAHATAAAASIMNGLSVTPVTPVTSVTSTASIMNAHPPFAATSALPPSAPAAQTNARAQPAIPPLPATDDDVPTGQSEWRRVLALLREEQTTDLSPRGVAARVAAFVVEREGAGGGAPGSGGIQVGSTQCGGGTHGSGAGASQAASTNQAAASTNQDGLPSASALRARMNVAARAKQFGEAHRLLDALWMSAPEMLEPRLLLWAAQRRTSAPRGWWGVEERQQACAMLTRALEADDDVAGALDAEGAIRAVALLETTRAASELYDANEATARELQSLQQHLSTWMARRGAEAEPLPWERPSATTNTLPAHIRKMARRYDSLRASLLRLARGEAVPAGGALASVAEETGSGLSARGLTAGGAGADCPASPTRANEAEVEEETPPDWVTHSDDIGDLLPPASPRPAAVTAATTVVPQVSAPAAGSLLA